MPNSIKIYQTKRNLNIYPDVIIRRGTIILLVTVTLLFGLGIIWLNHTPSLQHIWSNYFVDKKVPASFCEKTGLSNPVRQPINTFSSIIYLIIAIIIFKKSWEERYSSDTYNLTTANKTYSFLFGFVLLYVFAASSFYHASLISPAHRLDYSAVFSFSLFPAMFLLYGRWFRPNNKLLTNQRRKSSAVFFLSFLTILFLLTFLIPKEKEKVAVLVLILIFFSFAFFELKNKPDNPGSHYLVLSISSVLIGLLWFEFDRYKILCNPGSYFQMHSLWNLFIGVSAFYFFLYMRSEHKSATSISNDVIKKIKKKAL